MTFSAWQCPYWHLTLNLIVLLLPVPACVSCQRPELKQRLTSSQALQIGLTHQVCALHTH